MRKSLWAYLFIFFVSCLYLPLQASAYCDVDEIAYELVEENWTKIRRQADFTVSRRASFRVERVDTFGKGDGQIVKIVVYSKGFMYDITFTALFSVTWGNNCGYLGKLLEVQKGRFAGLSHAAREYLQGVQQ